MLEVAVNLIKLGIIACDLLYGELENCHIELILLIVVSELVG